MKKLFPVFLAVVLVSLLFSGCIPSIPTEGEGEEEVIDQGVTVDIDGAIIVDGKTYIAGGKHDITVTFSGPFSDNVSAYITGCGGDYSKGSSSGSEVILFPNADKAIWTGSGDFGLCGGSCCASYVQVESGECFSDTCIKFPVIVDSLSPAATIEVCPASCTCTGCSLSFTSTTLSAPCAADTENCSDTCSGLANWSIALYEEYPFDTCCDASCEEPVYTCSGTDCPITCTTDCLTSGTYYAIATLSDAVGNQASFGAQIDWDPDTCDTLILTDLDPANCLDTPFDSSFIVCADKAGYFLNLSADPAAAGTATDQTATGPYKAGETVSILATPNFGNEFINWTDNDNGDTEVSTDADYTFTMPSSDVNYTANIKEAIFAEDFSGEVFSSGWTIVNHQFPWPGVEESTTYSGYWYVYHTNKAGGSIPEMRFNALLPIFGTSSLITPAIDTSGASGLSLSFKHTVFHMPDGVYELRVQVSTDGGNSWEDPPDWRIEPTSSIYMTTVIVDLSAYAGQTIQLAWVFGGDNSCIDYWYIDDIVLN